MPPDAIAVFMTLADEVIGDLGGEAKVKAFWRPRLRRFAEWFAATEPARRAAGSSRLVEVSGRHVLDAPAGPFELAARADRIDVEAHGLVVSDYKTGRLPSQAEVEQGAAPQLTLEAAMAAAGAFAGLPAAPVTALRYIRATGGEPAGEERLIAPKEGVVADIAADAMARLAELVAAYDDPATPYTALRRRQFDYAYDDYAHLARIGEWSPEDGEGNP
jgi:ATP-dependent helicase/nuclease subunit B